ncbi:MAG: PD-(D/E)XK nuclease family protein [Clostridia bacterium]|nr:PD-(D/E)XK nuclease family protein [Clostridia bacterium]
MIHFVEGAAGSGKTYFLFDMLCSLAEQGNNKLIYLIPEQSSFETETAFLRRLGPKLCTNVKVMSFTRLYSFVMNETGSVLQCNIDDNIRKLLMSCTLEDLKEQLDVYSRPAARVQFIETSINAVKEFKQCGISPEMLLDAAQYADSAELEQKLSELALIYGLYNANIAQSGVDPLDNDMRLYNRLISTGFLKGYVVAVDDFSGFTAMQHKIIEEIMAQSEEFYISFCMEPSSKEDVFFTVSRTKQRITDSARKKNLKIASPVKLTKNMRAKTDAISRVENMLYRGDDEITEIVDHSGVIAVKAGSLHEECEYAAARINDLALSGKCRYRDIAVIARDTSKYEGIIDVIFDKYAVPYFMSRPEPIDNKPIIRLAVNALEFVIAPNDEHKIMDSIKSGLMGITAYSAAQLENYIFVWNLKGRDIFGEFKFDPAGFSGEMKEESVEQLQQLNETREKAAQPFSVLLDALGGGGLFTAREISLAVYEFMVNCGVPELLKQRALENNEFAEEDLRLWSMLCDVLNKMHEALGKRNITVKRYCELFKLVIKDTDISDIPQTLDQVIIGNADSLRLTTPYAVFVIGAVEGEFPHKPTSDGVFSDAQRGRLISLGLPLYDTVTELWLQEKFLVYNAMCAPQYMLTVSYPKSTPSGVPVRPSSIITEIQRIFPGIDIVDTHDIPEIMNVSNERTALELYAKTKRSGTALSLALGRILSESEEYRSRLNVIGKSIKNMNERITNGETAAAMFGRDKRLSPTQIEGYYSCRFKYFCDYGIHLRDRQKAGLDSLVYGNLMHYILEFIIRKYIESGYKAFTDDELKELVSQAADRFFSEELGGSEDKTKRFKYMYERSCSRALQVISYVMEELKQSKFKPIAVEQTIGRGYGVEAIAIEDANGNEISVNGTIDRVDIMEDSGDVWVRVVDYKSGGKKFNLGEVINGLNLQMLIYLMTLSRSAGNLPAAVLYMKADGGMVSIDKSSCDNSSALRNKAKSALREKLELNGLSVDDDVVKEGMNADKDRKFVKAEEVTKKQLAMIFDIVEDKLRSMSEGLDSGEIPAFPAKKPDTQNIMCSWCAFRDVCRIEHSDSINTIEKVTAKKYFGSTGGDKK